jgi:8-oxo-dGTP diphosphatase
MGVRKMPKATVGAIITKGRKPNLQILLTKRNIEPYENFWCLPGGHIDNGEKAIDAVVREVKEETGLCFNPQFFDYFDEILPAIGFYAVVMIYVGEAAGEIDIQEDEVADIRWFHLEEALKLDLAFEHNKVLKRYSEVS